MEAQRVAVIGGGVAGLSAAWLISKKHKVDLYEMSTRPGGHANTIVVSAGESKYPVDSAFVLFNEECYPNFVALLDYLGVCRTARSMSFSHVNTETGVSYITRAGWPKFRAPIRSLFRTRLLHILRDNMRFRRQAQMHLSSCTYGDISLGDYLVKERYSDSFIFDYLLPTMASLCSLPISACYDINASVFSAVYRRVNYRCPWYTIDGGSSEYVCKLRALVKCRVFLNSKVTSIRRSTDGIRLAVCSRPPENYDSVVVATNAKQALALLAKPSKEESRALSSFRYYDNTVHVHRDPRVMPQRRSLWAAWNHTSRGQRGYDRPVVHTYLMNDLHGIDRRIPIFCSLNPTLPPDVDLETCRINYSHPTLDHASLTGQKMLEPVQGENRTWFCGSYVAGVGSHEDALFSGLRIARVFDCAPPWPLKHRVTSPDKNSIYYPRLETRNRLSPINGRTLNA